MKHKRELTIRVDDALNVSFTDATSETHEGGVKRKESETSPMGGFGSTGSLAQAVGLRLGSFFGEDARFADMFEKEAEDERRTLALERAQAPPQAAPVVSGSVTEVAAMAALINACTTWRKAREAMTLESQKAQPDVPAITIVEARIQQGVKDIDEALDGIGKQKQ